MPILKQSKKALRQSEKRAARNKIKKMKSVQTNDIFEKPLRLVTPQKLKNFTTK